MAREASDHVRAGDVSTDIESLWMATTPRTDYAPLTEDVRVDVAVVGGGITGLTTALHLVEAGRDVAVLEADRIVEGTTGNTTAKLTSQHGLIYEQLCSTLGRERARQYADANEAAIDEVEHRIETLGIDAEFERTPAYVYAKAEGDTTTASGDGAASTSDSAASGDDSAASGDGATSGDVDTLRKEARAARRLGLPAEFTDSTDASFEVAAAVRFDQQAQFHPRKYLLGVAEAIAADGGHVFEKTRATGLETGSPCRVETGRATVTADDVVVASHFPFADRGGYFARMHPSRSYLLAVELSGPLPEGMYLGTDSPPPTFRPSPGEGRELLIVGGQSHTPGTDPVPTSERYRRCEAFAREHFPVESVVYRWSAHDYRPVDDVPFIGQLDPMTEHVYVATGFNKWGMTGGTAAGMILSTLVVEGSHPWADVFDPQRLSLSVSAGVNFLKGNAAVGARWVGDRAKTLLSPDDGDLPDPGEGTVLRRRGRPLAVSRDESGDLQAVSAVCPHMWCLVTWNDAEKTWDCPCHGSRFDRDGTVEHGPAVEDLPSREL